MGDLQVAETFQDRCFITVLATGLTATLLADVTMVIIDELGNRAAGVVTEQSDGWYTSPFTPDAAGTWATEWSKTANPENYVFHYPYKEFKVGGGEVTDIKADTADIVNVHTHVGAIDGHITADYTATEKAAIDLLDDAVGGLLDVHTDVADVHTDVADIHTDVGTVITNVGDLHTDVDTAITNIGDIHATDLPAVKAETALIVADTGELQTDWANGGRLDLLIDAIKARTDNRLQTVTFFSPCQIEAIADTSHTDAALPTVTIPNWAGTIAHVYAGFKFRMVENTNAAVNKLSGAQEIQINKAGGAWTDAINFVDDQFGLAATTREGGDVVMGIIDLVGTINVFNTTAQFQWDEPLTDQDALHFNDVQTFVIIQYY